MRLSLQHWAKTYGGVYKLKLPIGDTVVVSDYQHIHKVLVEDGKAFGGRISFFRFDFIEVPQYFGLMPPDTVWRRLRKGSHRYMKQFVDAVSRLEEILMDTADCMIETFSSSCNQPIDIMDIVKTTAMRSIAVLLLGQNLNEGDPLLDKLLRYEKDLTQSTEMTIGTLLLDTFPFLIHAPLQASRNLKNLNKLQAELWEEIKKMQATSQDESLTQVFLDMTSKNDAAESEEECSSTIPESVAKMSCLALILAGVVTTSRTMYCLLNTIAFRKDIQEKVYTEISNVLASDKNSWIAIAHRDRMPYLRATILECLRAFTPSPSGGMAHSPVDNSQQLSSYGIIPKGVVMLINAWALHHEEWFWKDPDVFRPERFLDDNGQLLPPDHPNRKHLLPFGAGPRVCFGEVFAKNRLLLWTARVVSKFEMAPGPDSDEIWMDPKVHPESSLLEPLPTRIVFTARK